MLVDLNGVPLELAKRQNDLSTEPTCHWDCPGLTDLSYRNRAILKNALEGQGFINFSFEWWHWSPG
jgi:zinc D-Ala-D-Ala dipeptidase